MPQHVFKYERTDKDGKVLFKTTVVVSLENVVFKDTEMPMGTDFNVRMQFYKDAKTAGEKGYAELYQS